VIDKSISGLLSQLRERKAGDVFRFVRFGDLNKAQLALGSVDVIDEIFRYFDFAAEAETRVTSLGESSSGRKLPQRVELSRAHDFPIPKNERSRNAKV
jgi:hypothetical protein